MISNNRVREKRKYLKDFDFNTFPQCGYFYPFLRQSLYNCLRDKEFNSVLLPSYIAEGVIDPFIKLNYKITFYDVDNNGLIDEQIFDVFTDVFVYVHYYGIYRDVNIETIRMKLNKNTLFIEDFAHVVYGKKMVLSGDLCLFSFTKTVGVTEGACILFNNESKLENCNYTSWNWSVFRLRYVLFVRMFIASYCRNRLLNVIITKLFSLWGGIDYYSILMRDYTTHAPAVMRLERLRLGRMDFEKIVSVRKEYARLYYDNLDHKFLYNFPKEAYLKQALFAFPIKVYDRCTFVTELNKLGISPLMLTSNWFFNDQGDKFFYETHVLLPLNQNLDKKDIYRVIDCVNLFKVEQC